MMMDAQPAIKWYAIMIDCKNPEALATFYAKLLGWFVPMSNEDYACAAPKDTEQGGYPCINFQRNPDYVPPLFPDAPGQQQTMEHLDFAVEDVEASVRHALACGATEAAQQFDEHWRVMLDPEGHPFCLCAMGDLMKSPSFALK